jgi:hypothetical protein
MKNYFVAVLQRSCPWTVVKKQNTCQARDFCEWYSLARQLLFPKERTLIHTSREWSPIDGLAGGNKIKLPVRVAETGDHKRISLNKGDG